MRNGGKDNWGRNVTLLGWSCREAKDVILLSLDIHVGGDCIEDGLYEKKIPTERVELVCLESQFLQRAAALKVFLAAS